jgi:hypothetical protein
MADVELTSDEFWQALCDAYQMGAVTVGNNVLVDGDDVATAVLNAHGELVQATSDKDMDFFVVGGYPVQRGVDPDDWFTSANGFKPGFQAWLLGRVK